MKKKSFFDLAFLIPYASLNFPSIRDFLKTVRSKFPRETLIEIQLFSWIGSKSLGLLFRFNFEEFVPNYFQLFLNWARKIQVEILELEKFSETERKLMLESLVLTSDVKFNGSYDLSHALDMIEERFKRVELVRNEPRQIAKMRVKFTTEDAFYKEYSINLSSGGMFIKTKVKFPLNSKLEVSFELPNKEEIKVVAKIIHLVDEEKAKLIPGMAEGFGIRFLEFLEDGDKKLKDYFETILKKNKM